MKVTIASVFCYTLHTFREEDQVIPRAVILDLDGTVAETESLTSRAYVEVLSSCGVTPQVEPWGCVHRVGIIGNMAQFKERYKVSQPLTWLKVEHRRIRGELIRQGVQPMPGIFEVLDLFGKRKVPIALASGSGREDIEAVLDQLRIRQHFQVIVSGVEVPNHKPAGDIYEETARRLGLPTTACLVFEDSEPGVLAAKSARTRVVAVPNQFTANDDLSAADLIVNSLRYVTWEVISSL